MKLKKLFIDHCKTKGFEINDNQIIIIDFITKFYRDNFSYNFFLNIFSKRKNIPGFYLQGDVGVGKTMILNFFYENFNQTKHRLHFNEFMISLHNFIYQNKDYKKGNIIDKFVSKLKKKYKLLYFDEFQVTNIVDAMILGRLFKAIFSENLKILISSNIKIKDLYIDGLQREQFIPFIDIIDKFCKEHELIVKQDYRKSNISKLERFFDPLSDQTFFQANSIFREITKRKINKPKDISIKRRNFTIKKYFEGYSRFNFNNLCGDPIGAEDYIKIAECCNFILIDNVPNFSEENADKQQRFITLIDILYEKRIPIMITADFNYENFNSSKRLSDSYKRTISRLFELTSPKFKIN